MVAALRGLVLDVVAMARTGRLKKSEYEALAEFRYELRKFIHFSEAAAQNAGITPQQHQALLAIKGFPGREEITIGELAERLQLRHHSVVGLIDRLVIEGLVSRVQSETDRRQVLVHLSNQGEKMLEKLSNIHRTQLKQLGPELNTLIERLNNIRD
jgi:DNA-binding MarR family transcriptional regulator